jgi:hypothetical protein
MTGTADDIIYIVIVPVVILALWLGMMFYVGSHPEKGGQTPADAGSTPPLAGDVPAQRLSGPGPVVPGQRPGTVAGEITSEQARPGAAPR